MYLILLNTCEYHFLFQFVSALKVSEINKLISTQTVLDLYNQKDSKNICNLDLQLHNCISSILQNVSFKLEGLHQFSEWKQDYLAVLLYAKDFLLRSF